MIDDYLLVTGQAKLYLDGLSLRDIARMYNVSHVTVHNNLSYRLEKYDTVLYSQVIERLEENRSTKQSIKESSVVERILNAYRLLVMEYKTLEQISEELDTPYFVIYRDLTVRLRSISSAAPKIVTPQMCALAEQIFRQHSDANLLNVNKNNCKNK